MVDLLFFKESFLLQAFLYVAKQLVCDYECHYNLDFVVPEATMKFCKARAFTNKDQRLLTY